MNSEQFTSVLIYAVDMDRADDDTARYLLHRTDSCVPMSSLTYRQWTRWTYNFSMRKQFVSVNVHNMN
jgi:hypothetical protein